MYRQTQHYVRCIPANRANVYHPIAKFDKGPPEKGPDKTKQELRDFLTNRLIGMSISDK